MMTTPLTGVANSLLTDAAVHFLLRSVPAAVTGIVFLSGGQSAELGANSSAKESTEVELIGGER